MINLLFGKSSYASDGSYTACGMIAIATLRHVHANCRKNPKKLSDISDTKYYVDDDDSDIGLSNFCVELLFSYMGGISS